MTIKRQKNQNSRYAKNQRPKNWGNVTKITQKFKQFFYNRVGELKLKVFNNLEKLKQMSVSDSCQGQTTRLMYYILQWFMKT